MIKMRVHVSSQAAGAPKNQNGGYYESGCSASLVEKRRISDIYTLHEATFIIRRETKYTIKLLYKHILNTYSKGFLNLFCIITLSGMSRDKKKEKIYHQ